MARLMPILLFALALPAAALAGEGLSGLRSAPDIAVSTAPPPAEVQASQGPVAVVVFHGGDLDMDVEEGGVHTKVKGVLRIPLDGHQHTLTVTYAAADGLPDTNMVVSGLGADGAYFVRVEGNGSTLAEDKGEGGNLFAEVEDTTVQRTSWSGNFFGGRSNVLGYGNAARWRLRSVPAGAQVSILDRLVSTDVDVARLESKYIRTLTFSKQGYQPCGFADARITEEETAGLPWTVVTCVLKRTGP